jgi:hypothetical protein
MNKKLIANVISLAFGLLLFSLCLWAVTEQIQKYDFNEVWQSLQTIPKYRLFLAASCTIISYWIMTGYDILALYFIRQLLPYRRIVLAAITSYAISNSTGFPVITGGAIRYRLYSAWGLSKLKIAQMVAFDNIGYWLGMLAISGILFLVEPLGIPHLLKLPFTSVEPIGAIFLSIVIGYLILSLIHKPLRIKNSIFLIPSLPFSIAQISLSACDWLLAAGTLYCLLVTVEPLSYPTLCSIYLLAQIAGLISHLPGGIGVFETVILLSLSSTIPDKEILGALLIFRFIYYFIPLLVALLLLAGYEIRRRRPLLAKSRSR